MNLSWIFATTSILFLGLAIWLWRQRDLARLQINLLEQEKALKNQVKSNLAAEFKDAFQSLAAGALESNTQQFFQLAKNNFTQATELQKTEFSGLIQPMSQALNRYQEHLQSLEKDRQRAFANIDTELKRVADTGLHLSKETAALKDALKRPHVRGRWGEVQLRNVIELAGMSEYADVSFQNATTDDEGGRHIPDMIVRMPGGRNVIVDAKTPIDAFMSSLEATTEEARRAEMLRHGRHVKDHVKKLSTRAYTEVVKESADFTVLFLPNESFLYAALEAEPDLVEYALQKKVLIATPPTLMGLLKVIRFGWNEEKMAENAQRISEMGQELHKRLCDFVDTYMAMGKFIDRAKEEFDKGKARLESRVLVQARRFETLGAKSQKSLLEPPPEA